jgi:2,3-bisphosphoglycerate-dependent phosphoglycerate mutase
MKNGKLILIRHHESEWNKLGKWTGVTNVDVTEYGMQKSEDMGELSTDIHIDAAFESVLVRTMETMSCILHVCKIENIPTTHAAELNERDYGDYTGKNKWEMKDLLGEEEFNKLRREWNYPVPNGETLKMVYERVVPYFQTSILQLHQITRN